MKDLDAILLRLSERERVLEEMIATIGSSGHELGGFVGPYAQATQDTRALANQVIELEKDREELLLTLNQLTDLLNRTSIALKGDPPPLRVWSFSDLPDLASELKRRASILTDEGEPR